LRANVRPFALATLCASLAGCALAPELLDRRWNLATCPGLGIGEPVEREMFPDRDNPPLTVQGQQLIVPRGAVSAPVTLRMEVPASANLLVRITADGADTFEFADSVTLIMNYARCRNDIRPDARLFVLRAPRGGTPTDSLGGERQANNTLVTARMHRLSDFLLATN
jgi:hypothetical protein